MSYVNVIDITSRLPDARLPASAHSRLESIATKTSFLEKVAQVETFLACEDYFLCIDSYLADDPETFREAYSVVHVLKQSVWEKEETLSKDQESEAVLLAYAGLYDPGLANLKRYAPIGAGAMARISRMFEESELKGMVDDAIRVYRHMQTNSVSLGTAKKLARRWLH